MFGYSLNTPQSDASNETKTYIFTNTFWLTHTHTHTHTHTNTHTHTGAMQTIALNKYFSCVVMKHGLWVIIRFIQIIIFYIITALYG